MHRRSFLIATAAALAAQPAQAQSIAERLLEKGPLPELSLGNPQASVTVIEYLSLTCHHCEAFHKTVWPELKAKYVDTGKVRYVVREFPLDLAALAGFMLARCAGENWYDVVDTLFKTQHDWSHADNKTEALVRIMGGLGVDRAKFEACLSDETLKRNVESVRLTAQRNFFVRSTPTFFVNGLQIVGVEPEKLMIAIETMLGN
jgi:protein-disulfide isomerase